MTADAGGERLRPVLDRMAEAATDWLASLPPEQRELLLGLLHQYLGWLPGPVAAVEAERISGDGLQAVHFGWAGGGEPGQPHYYRLQGPRLLIEYVNVQNGANHVHSVWRDPLGDFGQSSSAGSRS